MTSGAQKKKQQKKRRAAAAALAATSNPSPDAPNSNAVRPQSYPKGTFVISPALQRTLDTLKQDPQLDYYLFATPDSQYTDDGIVFSEEDRKHMFGLWFQEALETGSVRSVRGMYRLLKPSAERPGSVGDAALKRQLKDEFGVDIDTDGFDPSPALRRNVRLLYENQHLNYIFSTAASQMKIPNRPVRGRLHKPILDRFPRPGEGEDIGVTLDSDMALPFDTLRKHASATRDPESVQCMYLVLEGYAESIEGYGAAALKQQLKDEYDVDVVVPVSAASALPNSARDASGARPKSYPWGTFVLSPSLQRTLNILDKNPRVTYMFATPASHRAHIGVTLNSDMGLYFTTLLARAVATGDAEAVQSMYKLLKPTAVRSRGFSAAALKRQLKDEYGVDVVD